MGEKEIDCRGLACPLPILKTKEAIEKGDADRVTILVDNEAAKENVTRFLKRYGYEVNVAKINNEYSISALLSGSESCEFVQEETAKETSKKILVLLGADRMGRGDDELGRKLIANLIDTLKELGDELWRLVLLNSGVKLATKDSPVIKSLKELEQSGIHILVCGTCLNHFNLLDKKLVGETTNMLDIVTAIQLADKVITLT